MSSQEKACRSTALKTVMVCAGIYFFVVTATVELVGQDGSSNEPQAKVAANAGRVDFAHDILTVLKSKCAKCHTNDVYKGGLSLESREQLMDSGTVVIGRRSESDLFERITSDDSDIRMPPEGDPLTAKQIEKFGQWIDGDLEWPAELTLKAKSFKRPLALQSVELPVQSSDSGEASKHPIDRILSRYLKDNSVEVPNPLTDRQFFRRAKLDLLGQLPALEELGAIDEDNADREKLIDELLSRDRDYADHWLSFWNDLLRNDYVGTGYIDGGRKQITQWLHRSLMENKPYDQFVRELVNPDAQSAGFIKGIKWRGKVNASQIEPLQFSQNISQVFLGINMKCASCHNSFIDDWKLEDAYGLAAIHSDKPLEIHRCDVPTGETATSKFVFPELGEIDQNAPRKKRLEQLAKLVTSKENGRFSRTIVNRIWERMVGRGLVHPVDVMANEAWSEPLLEFLAADLVANDYDLKRTLKLIVTSKVYNASSVSAESKSTLAYVFQGLSPKRLTAEQLIDAIWDLTETAPANVDAAVHLDGKPGTAKWIWSDEKANASPAGEQVAFRYQFELSELPKFAGAVVTCDNSFQLFLNGKPIGKGTDWTKPNYFNLMKRVRKGKNEIIVKAANGGEAPNPAALYLQAKIEFKREFKGDLAPIEIRTDKDWQCVKANVKPANLAEDLQWQPAVELEYAVEMYASGKANLESKIAQLSAGQTIQTRASLVKSNDIMRSLGRPNREQVVTTRPAELSTLQALDLSNGESLSKLLNRGAKSWLEKKQTSNWSSQKLLNQVFLSALSRKPTAEEVELLTPAATESNEVESIEDLLWMVLMLPEFQFVR